MRERLKPLQLSTLAQCIAECDKLEALLKQSKVGMGRWHGGEGAEDGLRKDTENSNCGVMRNDN